MLFKTGIHDEDALATFMCEEQAKRDPKDFLQWRMYYFEDYSEHESVFVIKVHHSLADGIGFIFLASNM